MSHTANPEALLQGVLKRNPRALGRAISMVEDRRPGYQELLMGLYPRTGQAFVLGVTGPPGAGKSTLCDRLVKMYRNQDLQVAVIAVDPSSAFSGGAILGDRIRLQDHSADAGVFMRSMATRGHLGGLSKATTDVIDVLDAAGFDLIVIETVGVGQDEVDIIRMAHTSLVVLVPGLGDDIQAMKAGIMEIADIFVVNKADRDGADRVVTEIQQMLSLATEHPEYPPPIVKVSAVKKTGLDELEVEIKNHRKHCESHPDKPEQIKKRVRQRFVEVLSELAIPALLQAFGRTALEAELDRLVKKENDPYSLAQRILDDTTKGDRP